MPEKNEDFWNRAKDNNVETPKDETFAKGNLSGITPANARTASDPKSYYKDLHEKVKLDLFGDRSDWDKVGYSEQTGLDLATNTFYGTLTNMVAGIAEGIASNDLKGIADMSLGNTEQNYGNVLHDFANSIMEYSQDNFHIYDDGNNSPFSFEYWGKQLQNTGYSAGIILEMFGEQALLAAATRGAGNAATAGTLVSRFNKLKKLPGLLSKHAVFGSYQGVKESYLNGIQTGEETYRKFKDVGFSDEEAKQKANEAATLGFRMEVLPLMTLNALQFAAIGKYNPFLKKGTNLGYSGGFETLSDNVFKGVKNKYLKKLADYTTQAVSEGIEEGIQTGISKEAQYEIGYANGIVGKKQLSDRLFDDDEMRDSMIGGALGGTLFRAMGKRFNRLIEGTQVKQQKEEYDNFLKTSASRVNEDLVDLKEAFQSGDQEKVDIIRKRMQRNNVFEALKLDIINGKESAFDSYVSTLEEMNEAASSGDAEKLKSLGIEDANDVEHITQNYKTYIKDAIEIKEKLVNNLQYIDDYNIAVQVTNNEKTLEELIEFENRSNTNIQKLKSESKQYNKLTDVGKRLFDLEVEKTSLLVKARDNSITAEQKERLEEITTEQKEIRESNKKYKGRASDNRLLSSINTEDFLKESLNVLELQDYQGILSEKIKYWKNPKNQKQEKIKRAKNKIKKSKSVEEIKEARENLENQNELTPEVEEIIADKIEQAEVEEIANPSPIKEDTIAESEINNERKEKAQAIQDIIPKQDGEFLVLDNEDLFEPLDLTTYPAETLNKFKDAVGDYYESLKSDLGKAPIFEEFVKDFIKHNNREDADRIYNALVEGWKANNYKEVDFDKAYNNIFRSRKDISSDILNIAKDMVINSPSDTKEISKSNKETVENVIDEKAPTIKLDDNNRPILKDVHPFRTSSSILKAAHLSIPYKREFIENEDGSSTVVDVDASDNLNNPQYVNSNKLLNPDLFNPGTKLEVKIPDNYNEIKVGTWEDDFTKGPSMTFEKWARKNSIEKGSPEWLNKVPMIAYDQDGDGVFFIHDTEWYNAVNVGFKDDIQKQGEVISEARENLTNLRSQVYESNNLTIEITEKRPGTFKSTPKDTTITLNEANPEIQLALANDQGQLLLNGEEYFENDNRVLINTKEFNRGNVYDIRKSTTSNEYIAFEVLREAINPEVVSTLQWATKAYLYQYDSTNSISDNEKIYLIKNQVLQNTGLDLFDRADFENFLNLFIPTVKGKFSSKQDIVNTVNSNVRIKEGTPYIAIEKGALVFGVKGQKISGKNDILYVHPKRINDEGGAVQMQSMLRKFDEIINRATQHISKKGLAENRTLVSINEDGTVLPTKNYREFLKDNLKTTIKSFNVGSKENPTYATIIQPVINFKETQDEFETFVDTGKVSEKTIDRIAGKIKKGENLTTKEQAMRQEVAQEVENTLNEDVESINEKQVYQDALKSLREFGVKDNSEEIKFLKDALGDNSESLFEPIDITENLISIMKEDISGTEGLSILQDFQVVDYVFNEVSSKINFRYKSSVDKRELLKEVKDSYLNLIEPKKIKNNEIINNLKSISKNSPNEKLELLISRLENEVKIFDIIKKNWSNIENKALEKLYKYTGIQETKIKEDTTDIVDETTEKEKNYSKSALEENGKSTASYRLKRFFAGTKQVNPSGEYKTGFLGVPTYVGFDTVYSTIEQVISSPYEVDSDFDLMLLRLEENVENHKWLKQIIEELKVADQQIKNEFVYNFARHTLSMKFVMFSKNRDGSYTLKVYDTNANEVTRVIRRQWESNFKQSPLTYIEDGQYKINKERAKHLLKKFNNWKDVISNTKTSRKETSTADIPNVELTDWLADFGISISNETIAELKTKEIEYTTNDGKSKMTFNKMFQNSNNTAGIFGLLANYLEGVIEKPNTEFEENPDNHPFNNANNVLKTLARIESKYALYATTNSFRDGNKSIYGFTPTKHATDVVKDLKFNQEFRDQLLSKSFNKHSYLLDILNNDEAFRDKFYIDHLGITSLKELGKKVFGDNSITSLSNSDHELTKLGLFQDVEQGEISKSIGENSFVNIRMARMFLPTMSDKSQMLDLYTGVLDLKNKHFNISDKGEVTLTDGLKEILYSQLVKPELERMTTFNSTIKQTNIKGYDLAAKMFLFVPELNNLIDDATGKKALSLMINNPTEYNMEWFESTLKEKAKTIVSNLVKSEVNNKLIEWNKSGFVKEENGNKSIEFLNKKYFDRLNGSVDTKINIAANDYVINSLLTNANSYMLIAGDVAMYSQDKIKKHFQNGKPYLPKKEDAYSTISKEIIGINAGKRLALLLAPGNKLANSKSSDYIQVFLNDYVDITSNVSTLVDMFYGKEEADYAKKRVKDYNKIKTLQGREKIAKELSTKYPEIADYFDIEATDAQEYTTLSEHINVLWGQGRLSSNEYETINNKIKQQLEAENEGKNIPKSSMLNYSELKLVLQPIKPVYTGFKNEDRFDTMRMMYIKSSAFPLIPQVTKGTELDGLRKMLENYEEKTGKFVRASYQTANKVGAVTNAISPFLPDGTFNSTISEEQLEQSSLVLSRNNFRIQQDVPFKSSKRSEDTVSLGTQTLKLLFGDGILEVEGMDKLHSNFNETYSNYISHKKDMLYKQLKIDKNGQPIDIQVTMNLLQDLLKREAIDRGYPKQDVEALKLSPVLDSNGNVVDIQFSVPLWLSPNSNRYESLLNAIVSNQLVNIKLPGNSYVVGSEAGFKMKSDLSGINESRIVYTSKWKGELRAYEEGKLTQVLLPSKFRDNQGNLIQFIDENGNPNSLYTERDENGVLKLKEGMIDNELLNITSFRIPTSGHVSMAQVEIVGFLPTEVGDLMIVPKNLTKQKGLDFDIDKETTYQLHTYINEEGKITVLNEESKQQLLKIADSKGTEILNDNSTESKLMRAIFGDNPDFTDFDDNTFLDKLNDKLQQKLYENELVKTHSAVLSNHDPKVQRKINKILSMDFAKSQAQLVQNVIEENTDNKYFSLLSDSYQKDKMFLGASGKLGIGVYSNYVVFHSMIQQSNKPIQLMEYVDGEKKPLKITIGNQTSDGKLGNNESLSPSKYKRSIAEVFAERQNTATDNEKEQIMGRLNINELTINVDSLMSALGFDKDILADGREVSIPYLMLSQPIMKDYVEEMRKTQSNTNEFDSASKDKVIALLKEKYKSDEFDSNKVATTLTGQNLFNNLKDKGLNNAVQLTVLDIFLKLDDYGKNIGILQNKLNINNSGLGKSFFETIDKYYGVQNILDNNERNKKGIIISNASSLVGDYIEKNEDITENIENELLDKGYIEFENYYIKPTTPVGSMLVNTVNTGYNLWKNYFPYDDNNIRLVTDEILKMTSDESTSAQKIIEIQQNIFKEMKKYFVSSEKLGLFLGNPQEQRQRLFIDTEESESLATYLRNVINEENSLKSNKLLSRFEFQLNKNGVPSLIKFDNTKGENFDEDYLYISLIELMDENMILPDFNGESYSTKKLAEDLIAYSYLEGGIQEAIQFTKYIPISYLNAIDFGQSSRKWKNSIAPGIFKNMLGVNKEDVSRFTRQYLQHNPQRLLKVDADKQIKNPNYNGKNSGKLSSLTSFKINVDALDNTQVDKLKDADFVSIYNPEIKKGLKKFQVYERIGDEYKRVSALGVFGMSEYSIRDNDVRTLVNDYYKVSENSKPINVKKQDSNDIFNIKTASIQDIINSIAEYDFETYKHLKPIAKTLTAFVPNDIRIKIEDITNSVGERVARGRYSNGTISIDSYYFENSNNEDLAKTVLHELIHGLTSDYINQYIDKDGKYKVENPPKEIIDLVILFNETKKKLGSEIEKYKLKREEQLKGETSSQTTERERTVAYAGTDIREFVTLVMTEPNFQKEMMNTKYKATDINLFDKLASIVNSILEKVFGADYNKNSITAKGVRTSLEIIKSQAKTKQLSKYEKMKISDSNAEQFVKGINDSLNEPNKNTIFVDPFKC